MNKCMKGWGCETFNTNGDCCCNCIHFKKVMCHPWNEGGFKGKIFEQVKINNIPVHVCTLGHDEGVAYSMTKEHGMCECHQRKCEEG